MCGVFDQGFLGELEALRDAAARLVDGSALLAMPFLEVLQRIAMSFLAVHQPKMIAAERQTSYLCRDYRREQYSADDHPALAHHGIATAMTGETIIARAAAASIRALSGPMRAALSAR